MKEIQDGYQNEFLFVLELLNNKLMEIRKNANHFYNSTVVPYQNEYCLDDVLSRIKDKSDTTYLIKMDLLENYSERISLPLARGCNPRSSRIKRSLRSSSFMPSTSRRRVL